MRTGGWWGAVILVLTGLAAGGDQGGEQGAGSCPAVCQCKWRDGKEAALCVRAGLRALPALPPGTQLLDLAGNKLAGGVLPPRALAGRGLLHLQRLVLAECGLRELRPGALAGLRNLVALDLANNLLSAVPTRALSAASELRDLSLAGNPLLRLADDSLQGLTRLERLDVSGCRLREVAPRALTGAAGSLRLLRLADNGLRELPAAAVGALRALAALELAGNPWECECRLRPLLVLLRRRNLPPGAPECAAPARLAARPWSTLNADDFACAPTAHATESSVRAREGGPTSLSCTVEGDPPPDVRWSRAGRPFSDDSPRVSVRTDGAVSRVVVSTVKARDGGVYTCVAENRAGRAEVTVALTIVRGDAPPEREAGRRAAAAAATIAGGALACGAVYVLCRRLRGRKLGARPSRAPEPSQTVREERYNKVPDDKGGQLGESPPRVRGQYVHVPLYDPDSPPGPPPAPAARTHSSPQPDLHIPRRDRDRYRYVVLDHVHCT